MPRYILLKHFTSHTQLLNDQLCPMDLFKFVTITLKSIADGVPQLFNWLVS